LKRVQLEKADGFLPRSDGYERHGVIPFLDAAAAVVHIRIGIRQQGQVIAPETAALREIGRIPAGAAGQHETAETFKDDASAAVNDGFPGLIPRTKGILRFQETGAEAIIQIIGEVAALPEAQAQGVEAEMMLDYIDYIQDDRLGIVLPVYCLQDIAHHVLAFGVDSANGDIAYDGGDVVRARAIGVDLEISARRCGIMLEMFGDAGAGNGIIMLKEIPADSGNHLPYGPADHILALQAQGG